MIYDKPRDINLRVFPSLGSFAPKGRKKDNAKTHRSDTEKTITLQTAVPLTKVPPIADKTPITVPEKVFGNAPVPKIGGDSLQKPSQTHDAPTQKPLIPTIEKSVIDISEMPDIEGIPLLALPEEIRPEVLEEAKKERETDIEPQKPLETSPLSDMESPFEKAVHVPPIKEDKEIFTTVKEAPISKAKQQKKKSNAVSENRRSRIVKIASFFIMLYLGTAVAFIIPLRPTYSETEKRNLAEFPKFSAQALASGSYFYDISTWFSDTFPYRELLTKANTKIKSLYGFDSVAIHGEVDAGDEIPDIPLVDETSEPDTAQPVTQEPTTQPPVMPNANDLQSDNGDPNAQKPDVKTESLGAIIVAGNSAYEYYSFSESLAPRFIGSVNNIKKAANKDCDVYAMVVPTSIDITLNDALRSDIKSANQKKALDYFNASFKNVTAVDGIYDAERLHRDEYTYFRTDHHWTALGAYYAYEQFAAEKGVTAVPLSKYKTKTFDGFLGTFYASSGQSPKLGNTPDSVTAYLPFNNITCRITESNGNSYDWEVVKDASDYSQSLKYLAFIGGDNALTTITNADNPQGETCVVIKESYGNAFVPFLIPHYSTVYVIDPRHYNGTLGDFAKDKDIDDIIFIANISTTRNSVYIDAMEDFIK